MKSSVTGKVAAVSDHKSNDYFNIALDDADKDDNWFIGDGSVRDYVDSGLDDGQRVRLSFDNESVNGIEVVGSGSSPSSGEGGGSSDEGNTSVDSGRGANPDSSSSLSKQDNIRLQVAFKEACETVRSNVNDVDNQGEHLETVGELTNGYFNLLQAQAKDKSQNGGEQ